MLKTMTVRATIAAMLYGLCMSAYAVADTARPIDVPPGDLVAALESLARQADIELVYRPEQLRGIHTRGVTGTYEPKEAVSRLLKGTLLTIRTDDATGVMLVAPPTAPKSSAPSGEGKGEERKSFWSRLRLAQSDTPAPSQGEGRNEVATGERERVVPKVTELEQIIVTGTHIRGGASSVSPLIDISQEQIIAAGQANLGEVIRSIPQNFSGGQNPGIVFAGGGGVANQNATGGSAINLRGLGPDATLTLLNGRRLSYDGMGQAVDVSLIPVGALDRIEIVADGASAVYGSDAVGGVANVILKKDYDGMATTARVAGATSGGGFQQQYGLVGGSKWTTGGFIGALNYEDDSNIRKEDRSYAEYLLSPYTLLPSNRAKSAVVSGHQSAGDLVELNLTGMYAHRNSTQFQTATTIDQVQRESEQYTVSPTVTFKLPSDWRLSLNGIYGRDEGTSRLQSFSLADGSLTSSSATCYCNSLHAVELDGDGEVFQLPGGGVRGAFGTGYRENTFDQRSLTSTTRVYGREHSVYAFGEVLVPLVSQDMQVAAISRLSFSGAVRYERYGNFGDVTTPKLGLIYSPTQDFDLKASWGKSFKAPTLLQVNDMSYAQLFPAAFFGAAAQPLTATAFLNYGGNRDLAPERATSWTASLALHPRSLPALRAHISFFHIDYTDRVLLPIPSPLGVMNNPAYAQFIDLNPTQAQQQALIAGATRFLNLTGRAYDPANVIAIVNDTYINVAVQKIHGVDVQGSYRFSWGGSSLTLTESASWLRSTQRNNSVLPEFDVAGTIYNQPHWRSRLGLAFERGALTVSAFHNFIGGVLDTTNSPNLEIDPMRTVDITGVYRFGGASGVLHDTDLVLSIQNVANERPPYYSRVYPLSINYDSNNYSAIGRFISLAVTRRW